MCVCVCVREGKRKDLHNHILVDVKSNNPQTPQKKRKYSSSSSSRPTPRDFLHNLLDQLFLVYFMPTHTHTCQSPFCVPFSASSSGPGVFACGTTPKHRSRWPGERKRCLFCLSNVYVCVQRMGLSSRKWTTINRTKKESYPPTRKTLKLHWIYVPFTELLESPSRALCRLAQGPGETGGKNLMRSVFSAGGNVENFATSSSRNKNGCAFWRLSRRKAC